MVGNTSEEAQAGEAKWWQEAVVYQIYPRSFCDTNGDGVGDLEGVRQHLDHLQWLGVDAIWISPFYRSPMRDFGYDVADYCSVDPLFGTMDDFDHLIADAHARGIRVIMDWVPNHTSDQHPWFVESRSSPDSAKRDWYVWRPTADDGGHPNNWRAAFTEHLPLNGLPAPGAGAELAGKRSVSDASVWTKDPGSGDEYLHLFLPEQPDVNWRNPDLVAAMHDVLRFWLDRGVDGFRADVLHCIVKDDGYPDDPVAQTALPKSDYNDCADTHEAIRGIRRLLDYYPGDRMIVGEIFLKDTAKVATYYGDGDEVHLAFNFPPLFTPWNAVEWHRRIDEVEQHIESRGAWPSWVLSNHDNPRHRSRYGGSERRARAAAVMLLTLRGTPFLFQGEELGAEDAVVPPEHQVDPGGRDGTRAPMPWDAGDEHGWQKAENWLPWPPQADVRNAASQQADEASVLHLYRRLLQERRATSALSTGSFRRIDAPADVVAYERRDGDERRVVAVNFSDESCGLPLEGDWKTVLTSDGAPGTGSTAFDGRLGPEQAVVLAPA